MGVEVPVAVEKLIKAVEEIKIDPTGELGKPVKLMEAGHALNKVHGYQLSATDTRELEQHGAQLLGQFLLDRQGIVRWANIECAAEGPAGFGKFPADEQLLDVVSKLPKP